MRILLLLLFRLQRRLLLCQTTAHGAGELGSEIERHVLLALVEETELGSLVGVDDCEDFGDCFPDIGAANMSDLGQSIIGFVFRGWHTFC